MRHTGRLIPLGGLVLALAACGGGGGGASGGGEAEKLTIAVIPKGTSHVFWQSIHAGAVKAAREVGAEVIWRGPLREDDRDSQVSEVEGFVSRGVDGIVLAPLDDSALVSPVASATRSGIPVVIIDSGLKGGDYVSFVATDNRKGGRLGGEHLARALGGKGKVAMLRYAEGSASTNEREDGFLEAMKASPGLQVVSSNQYGGADVESAYKKSENLLSNYKRPDGSLGLDGIFTPNESTTFAMLRVLLDNGWAGKVRFVGFDASENLVKALREGHVDALVVQDPINMGYQGVKTIVAHIKGQPVEKRIDTGVQVATRENMDQPELKDVLHPDLSQWLKQ
ncbi:MAG TPA: substrate-binding domain-containing protein [Vicinamibacteria bacterium]|nr:substrate-binding domain-containing protein [Vicinamibacteria bacterium]